MTTPTTAPTIADTLLPAARAMLWYAESATKDIPAERFARCPDGVKTSSPAFIIGHLALYPDKMLAMLGLPHETNEPYSELFAAGNECRNDPKGSIYPPKDELLKVFFARYRALMDALPGVDEAQLARPNTNERMRDSFPTVGALLTFMLLSHTFMHLGQISTWRRVMGLGPCMKM